MRYFLSVFVLFVFASRSSAVMTFERWYSPANGDVGWSVQQTTDGGYIVAGQTTIYDDGTWVYLVKTDANGDTLWTKTYAGVWLKQSVRQITDGGYIIAGGRKIIKTDSLGDTLWTRKYSTGTSDYCYSVRQTFDGGYIVTGRVDVGGYVTFAVWLIKTDPQGDTLWTKIVSNDHWDCGYCVQQTADSGYVIAAEIGSWIGLIKTDPQGDILWQKKYWWEEIYWPVSFVQQTTDGGYILVARKDNEIYLMKTDTSGVPIRAKKYGGECGYSVDQTTDGGYIVTGNKMEDLYLIKTNQNLDTLWTRTYGGKYVECGYSVQQTVDGGYIVAGVTSSYGVEEVGDLYLIKTDSEGLINLIELIFELSEQEAYDGAPVSYPLMVMSNETVLDTVDLSVTDMGFGWTVGLSDSTIVLDPLGGRANITVTVTPPPSPKDTVEYDVDTCYLNAHSHNADTTFTAQIITHATYSPPGISESKNQLPTHQPQVFPNPFIHKTSIEFRVQSSELENAQLITHNPQLNVYDLSGRLVETTKGKNIGKNLKPGIYFLKAKGYKPVKVVKLR